MFTTDRRQGTISVTISNKSKYGSYEVFVEEFMSWWCEEIAKRRGEDKYQKERPK